MSGLDPRRSLRARLVLLIVVVEALMILAILWNSQRLTETHLLRQFALRQAETSTLLQAALATPMAQRDYATVSETLADAQQVQGMSYLVMFDEGGQQVAAVNLRGEPPRAASLSDPPRRLSGRHDYIVPIEVAGRVYGRLQVGMDLGFLETARQEVLLQNLLLGLLGIAASGTLLAALALWLTRRLDALSTASRRLAAGEPFQAVPGAGSDDIGTVIRAFNDMAAALEQRLGDLHQAEREQRALAQTIETERSRLDALLAAMRLGLVFVTPDAQIAYVNPAFRHLWATPLPDHLAGMAVEQLVVTLADSLGRGQQEALFSGQGTLREITLGDGRILTQHSVPVLTPGGEEVGRLWIFEDITSERLMADRLLQMAETDPLTGLANRARFEAELARMVGRRQRDPQACGALIYFDLDEFKAINDSFGHSAGDEVLIRTAETIGRLVRSDEMLARLGGDEFVILAPDTDERGAIALAERIKGAVGELVYVFDQRRISLTLSIGIALFPEHATDSESLVAHGDAAMYQAKHAGKNCWRVFNPAQAASENLLDQLGWHEKIQAALRDERFCLHFQGVHDTSTGRLVHYEALVRMIDPEQPDQLLAPGTFIPAAERTGRIVDIDRWVLGAAVRQLAAAPDMPPIAVNISARSFDDPALPAFIRQLLHAHHVAPARLMIELTESAALSNIQDSERFVGEIRELGCTVFLDDFGVGFSSFAYLKHLSADVLKIDGMFIRHLTASHEDQVFVRAIVEIARGLGKKTVAEFVGDAATLTLLAELGVDYAQGYYLSRPSPETRAS